MSLSAVEAALLRESYGPITSATEGTSSHKNGHISTTAALPSKIVADSESSLPQLFLCGRMVPELFGGVTKKNRTMILKYLCPHQAQRLIYPSI